MNILLNSIKHNGRINSAYSENLIKSYIFIAESKEWDCKKWLYFNILLREGKNALLRKLKSSINLLYINIYLKSAVVSSAQILLWSQGNLSVMKTGKTQDFLNR